MFINGAVIIRFTQINTVQTKAVINLVLLFLLLLVLHCLSKEIKKQYNISLKIETPYERGLKRLLIKSVENT